MKRISALAIALVSIGVGPAPGDGPPDARLREADRMFSLGALDAARQRYEGMLAAEPARPEIVERMAYLCHLTGQYKMSAEWFDRAMLLNPARRITLLAYSVYTHYLMGDYPRALDALKEVDSSGYRYKTAFLSVEQLRQLAIAAPRFADSGVGRTTLVFDALDPLPVVQIRINSRPVRAFIDTGGPQLVVDADFAREQRIRPLSETVSRGVGGKSGQRVGFAVAETLDLGEIQMGNVPVMILPVRGTSKLFGVQIDAVLGTETLSQFLPTLDFPGRRLVLRTKTEANRDEVRRMRSKTRLPFILDDIHSMYAQCRVNERERVLFYFDTGLVDDRGASILTSGDRLAQLGVAAPRGSKSGYVDLPQLGIGSLERSNVKALYGAGAPHTDRIL